MSHAVIAPRGAFAAALLVLVALAAARAGAQVIERPGDERPALPGPLGPAGAGERPLALPELPPPAPEEGARLSAGLEVFVREFRIVGSSVFSAGELQEVVAPWANRRLRSEDLAAVQRALTLFYVEQGYVNSGAVLPDQDAADGVVEVRIVEGRLSGIEVSGQRSFRASRLRERVALGTGVPLDVQVLEERLALLQQDPRIERLSARLAPGDHPGEARLLLEVEEASPWRAVGEASNHEPPSIGAIGGRLSAGHANLLGFGDEVGLEIALTDGLERFEGRYEIPVAARGTSLRLEARTSNAGVVEEPFDAARIESRFQSYGIGLRHPVYQSLVTTLALGADAEWRRSRTSVEGVPFPFPGTGAEGGRSTAAVLRFVAEALRRDPAQALAARSTLSVGVDALGATTGGGGAPDGRFVAWLAQLQWARRFEPWGVEAVARTDLQLADDPLLTLEQFALGGHESVRGYRENQLVRDQGVAASLELRIPVWSQPRWGSQLVLVPFFDLGHGFSPARAASEADTLAAAGIALRLAFTRFLDAELSWGRQLDEADTSGDLQDHGIQFLLRFDLARLADR